MLYMVVSGLIVGALLGFVMQRGRFCLTGGFRDMYLAKNYRIFYAMLIAIAVQSIGVFALIQFGVFEYSPGQLSLWATIAGTLYFRDRHRPRRRAVRREPGTGLAKVWSGAGSLSSPICSRRDNENRAAGQFYEQVRSHTIGTIPSLTR